MKGVKDPLEEDAKLRRRAEERWQEAKDKRLPQTEHETQRLLHELEVHQIELEMQNEKLHQAHEKMEEVLGRYTDLYDFAPVGYFTLDLNGFIRAVNLAGATLLGLDRLGLLGRRFDSFIATDASPVFTSFLSSVADNSRKESLF